MTPSRIALVRGEGFGGRAGHGLGEGVKAAAVAGVQGPCGVPFGGDVEVRVGACACEGDIAPLGELAAVAGQDVGVVDGGALGGVHGERVCVSDMLGRVLGGQGSQLPVVGAEHDVVGGE